MVYCVCSMYLVFLIIKFFYLLPSLKETFSFTVLSVFQVSTGKHFVSAPSSRLPIFYAETSFLLLLIEGTVSSLLYCEIYFQQKEVK